MRGDGIDLARARTSEYDPIEGILDRCFDDPSALWLPRDDDGVRRFEDLLDDSPGDTVSCNVLGVLSRPDDSHSNNVVQFFPEVNPRGQERRDSLGEWR